LQRCDPAVQCFTLGIDGVVTEDITWEYSQPLDVSPGAKFPLPPHHPGRGDPDTYLPNQHKVLQQLPNELDFGSIFLQPLGQKLCDIAQDLHRHGGAANDLANELQVTNTT
jgi:hypothetical protein